MDSFSVLSPYQRQLLMLAVAPAFSSLTLRMDRGLRSFPWTRLKQVNPFPPLGRSARSRTRNTSHTQPILGYLLIDELWERCWIYSPTMPYDTKPIESLPCKIAAKVRQLYGNATSWPPTTPKSVCTIPLSTMLQEQNQYGCLLPRSGMRRGDYLPAEKTYLTLSQEDYRTRTV